jgi:hypothetical protein
MVTNLVILACAFSCLLAPKCEAPGHLGAEGIGTNANVYHTHTTKRHNLGSWKVLKAISHLKSLQ